MRLRELFGDRRGAVAVEYALILALIFLAIIAGVQAFADASSEMWDYVANEVLGA